MTRHPLSALALLAALAGCAAKVETPATLIACEDCAQPTICGAVLSTRDSSWTDSTRYMSENSGTYVVRWSVSQEWVMIVETTAGPRVLSEYVHDPAVIRVGDTLCWEAKP